MRFLRSETAQDTGERETEKKTRRKKGGGREKLGKLFGLHLYRRSLGEKKEKKRKIVFLQITISENWHGDTVGNRGRKQIPPSKKG